MYLIIYNSYWYSFHPDLRHNKSPSYNKEISGGTTRNKINNKVFKFNPKVCQPWAVIIIYAQLIQIKPYESS
jgi:hypothetical protein